MLMATPRPEDKLRAGGVNLGSGLAVLLLCPRNSSRLSKPEQPKGPSQRATDLLRTVFGIALTPSFVLAPP